MELVIQLVSCFQRAHGNSVTRGLCKH